MKKLETSGLSGFVGKVNTDRNAPEILIEESDESIKSTLSYIEKSREFKNIKPIITPRFIPTCSDYLLKELGKISKKYKLPVQSHLSENLSEIEWVKEHQEDFTFSMVTKDTDEFIGNCGFNEIHDNGGVIGIFISPKFQNIGLGTEAITELIRFGFEDLNLEEIRLVVFSHNERAIRCYQKLGFREYKRKL